MNPNGISSSIGDTFRLFNKEHLRQICQEPVKTGFDRLDKALGGGLDGLVVLGAMSGMGKSTFALQVAANVASQGRSVLYFSLEMPRVKVASKLLSCHLFKNRDDLRDPIEAYRFTNAEEASSFQEKDWAAIEKQSALLSRQLATLHAMDAQFGAFTAAGIRSYVMDFIGKEDLKPLVIVDYLQILGSDKPGALPRQIVDESLQAMRRLSTEEKIPVLLISSFNREGYNKPIGMEAFKESGNIEYSADIILGLQCSAVRKVKNPNIDREKARFPRDMEIVILKQRYGTSGGEGIPFDYYAKYDYFEERDPDASAEAPLYEEEVPNQAQNGRASYASWRELPGKGAPPEESPDEAIAGPGFNLQELLQKERDALFEGYEPPTE